MYLSGVMSLIYVLLKYSGITHENCVMNRVQMWSTAGIINEYRGSDWFIPTAETVVQDQGHQQWLAGMVAESQGNGSMPQQCKYWLPPLFSTGTQHWQWQTRISGFNRLNPFHTIIDTWFRKAAFFICNQTIIVVFWCKNIRIIWIEYLYYPPTPPPFLYTFKVEQIINLQDIFFS